MHLSPSALTDAIRLLERPASRLRTWRHCGDGAGLIRKLLVEQERVVSLNLTSWNQLAVWLRQVERVQSAA